MISEGKYLVTTDRSYFMPDGKEYKSFWGECETMFIEDFTGFKPMPREVNWMLKMNKVYIAGCDIHCWVKTDKPPAIIETEKWNPAFAMTVKSTNIYYTDEIHDL